MSPLELLRRPGRIRWMAAVLGAAAILAAAFGGERGATALAALAVLAALGVASAALSRRSAAGAAQQLLEVESRAALARDSGLALVRAAGRRFLVGFGPAGVAALAEIERDGGGS